MTFFARHYKLILTLVACALVLSASVVQRHLNAKREGMGLTRIDPLDNAPPMLAFTTVALGGFRGLIANFLWVRLADLQEQDKFFEMVQLSDWISKLQPHFATIWVHLAWNMSYNISVKFNDARDRWHWVRRGIELLRDEGLRYNPKEPLIYRELGWHFQHKMGHNLDDAHNHYKAVWLEEMTKVFGAGRPNFDEMLNPETPEALERVRVLREKYKMDPRWLKEVEDRYGPLEWRLPEAHAIYWAYVGLETCKNETLKEQDFITLRRVIFQSMQLAFHRGRLIFPKRGQTEFTTAPNLAILERTSRTYEELMQDEPDMKKNIETAHKNFLKTAVYFLYEYNRLSEAGKWLDVLREKYPGAVPASQSLDDYALARFAEDIGETSHDKVKAALEGMIWQTFISLAIDEDEQAVSYDRLAQRIWNRFQAEIGRTAEKRVGLPPLTVIKQEVLDQILNPETGLDPQIVAQLRTKLGLPAPSGSPSGSANPPPRAQGSTNASNRPVTAQRP